MISGRLGARVGTIDGSPVYWQPIVCVPGRVCADQPTLPDGPGPYGTLRWQYAPGAWASITTLTLQDALPISSAVRFGPKVAPPIPFPFQLTGVPAGWQIGSVSAGWPDDGLSEFGQWTIAASPRTTWSTSAPRFSVNVGSFSCQGATRDFNGRTVTICPYVPQMISPTVTTVIGRDGNLPVVLTINLGTHPTIGLADLFEHHLRLFGANPRDWTTQPIR